MKVIVLVEGVMRMDVVDPRVGVVGVYSGGEVDEFAQYGPRLIVGTRILICAPRVYKTPDRIGN